MSDAKPEISSPNQAVGPLAAQVARAYAKVLSDTIAPLAIAPAQFLVLRALWKRDGITQSELARKLDVEQATMANTVKRMARDGLVAFAPHPRDGRATSIRLTDRSRGLEKEAKAAAKKVNALAVAGLSRKEQKRFVELSRRVIGALKDADGKPAASGEHPAV